MDRRECGEIKDDEETRDEECSTCIYGWSLFFENHEKQKHEHEKHDHSNFSL